MQKTTKKIYDIKTQKLICKRKKEDKNKFKRNIPYYLLNLTINSNSKRGS